MKRKAKTIEAVSRKKLAVLAGVLLAVLLIGVAIDFAIAKYRYYEGTAAQANIVTIRELILQAVNGLKKDAPVDPKTGDVYFPESRLYLPNPGVAPTLTYLYDQGDVTNSQGELSVSTRPVRGTTQVYSAQNVNELFHAVPKLQACSRGIKIVHQKFPSDDTDNEFKYSVRLNNRQEVYVYLEKNCPELNSIVDIFKNLKAY